MRHKTFGGFVSDKNATLAALALSHTVRLTAQAYGEFERTGNPWALADAVKAALEHADKYLKEWNESV